MSSVETGDWFQSKVDPSVFLEGRADYAEAGARRFEQQAFDLGVIA